MKITNLKLVGTAFALSAGLLASQAAIAVSTTGVVELYNNGSIATQGGFASTATSGGFAGNAPANVQSFANVTWTPAATAVWNDWPQVTTNGGDIPNQSTDVGAWVNLVATTFGTAALSSTTAASTTNGLTGSGAGQALNFGTTINYLAIHYDNKEALWYFANGITSFTSSTGFPQDWSNYRAYTAVPIPFAAWMVGSALVGLVGFGRKKSSTSSMLNA
jgi:hypothetical protein